MYLSNFSHVRYDLDYTNPTDRSYLLPKGSYFLGEEKSYVDEYTNISNYPESGTSHVMLQRLQNKYWTKYVISGVANDNKLTVFGP